MTKAKRVSTPGNTEPLTAYACAAMSVATLKRAAALVDTVSGSDFDPAAAQAAMLLGIADRYRQLAELFAGSSFPITPGVTG